MHKSKLLVTALMAAITLGALTVGASANRLSVNQRNTRIVWSNLEFGGGGFAPARCPVTLEGSFHSATLAKVLGSLIGSISRATVGACASGSATVLAETLPWHLTYNGFRGVLPEITGVNINMINASFRVDLPSAFAPPCLSRTSPAKPSKGIADVTEEAGGALKIRTMTADSTATIPCTVSGFEIEGTFAGVGQVYRLGTTIQDVLIRLI